MAAPNYSAAANLGNIVGGNAGQSVAHATNVAALVDLSTKVAGYLSYWLQTQGSAITAAAIFNLYRIPAATAVTGYTTLTSGYSSGVTSIVVASNNGIRKNAMIFLSPATGGLGEIVTVSAISGTTLTVNATVNAYLSGDFVYLIDQTPTISIAPGTAWAATTPYDAPQISVPGNTLYAAQCKNTDGSNAVTAWITLDVNPAFQ